MPSLGRVAASAFHRDSDRISEDMECQCNRHGNTPFRVVWRNRLFSLWQRLTLAGAFILQGLTGNVNAEAPFRKGNRGAMWASRPTGRGLSLSFVGHDAHIVPEPFVKCPGFVGRGLAPGASRDVPAKMPGASPRPTEIPVLPWQGRQATTLPRTNRPGSFAFL